jgi:hypothetical protein
MIILQRYRAPPKSCAHLDHPTKHCHRNWVAGLSGIVVLSACFPNEGVAPYALRNPLATLRKPIFHPTSHQVLLTLHCLKVDETEPPALRDR